MNNAVWKKSMEWKVHHILFWVIYYFCSVYIYRGYYHTLTPLLVTTAIYVVCNATAFYLIAYFLVQRFLNEKKVLAFVSLALTVVLVSTLALSLGLYLMFRNEAGAAEFVNNWSLLFFSALSSTGFIAGSFTSIKLIVEKIRFDRKSMTLERQRIETELQFLKAQVNPHFLFNAINSVYVLIKKDPELAAETLIKLFQFAQVPAYECSLDKIGIEQELEYINNYIDLEKLRKGERVKVSVDIEENLKGFYVAPFLFIPFLENAFKFVSRDSRNENGIEITLKREQDLLTAHFTNSCDSTPGSPIGGIGLKNVRRRLELLYPDRHQLEIGNEGGRFQVKLSLAIW